MSNVKKSTGSKQAITNRYTAVAPKNSKVITTFETYTLYSPQENSDIRAELVLQEQLYRI